MPRVSLVIVAFVCWLWCAVSQSETTSKLADALRTIDEVGPQGERHDQAMRAWKVVSNQEFSAVPTILGAMTKDNVLANNWLRAAVETVLDRNGKSVNQSQIDLMLSVLRDESNAARAREIAYEWLVKASPDIEKKLLENMLSDSSLELRRRAVAAKLGLAAADLKSGKKKAALDNYLLALKHARDVDQIEVCDEKLKELGTEVSLADHFGFVLSWYLVAPFDNREKIGFDRAYPPESSVDVSATYLGKDDARVKWVRHRTDDKYGMVDVKKVFGKNKGSAAYAYAEFKSDAARPAELRLGCINANKIWLNGELLTANHVYHAGTSIDQYVGKGRLRKGTNAILLKICENEQTEQWAQDWQFQLRVCDELGTAILATDRVTGQLN